MKPFEIFRTGTHTSLNGQSKNFSESDLDTIASSYNPSEHEAPIVIGHPETNAPAYGWIEKLKRVGDRLVAFPKQVSNEFSELVKSGAFKKRSISITPDLKLNHVGFLGAAAPAVKGLKDVEFAENPEEQNFASFELDSLTLSEYEDPNKETMQSKRSEDPDPSGQSNNVTIEQSSNEALSSKLDQFAQELSSLKASLLQFAGIGLNKDALDKIHQRIDELRFSMQTNEFELMLNEKLAYGSLTPAMKNKIMKIVGFLQKQNFASSEFSSNDFNRQVNSLFTELVDTFPQLNLNSDFAEKQSKTNTKTADDFEGFEIDSDQLKVHQQALNISQEKNISYLAAVKELVGKE
jgi:hypothetical protein